MEVGMYVGRSGTVKGIREGIGRGEEGKGGDGGN